MKTRDKIILGSLAAGGTLGAWSLGPSYLKGALKGAAYALGLKGLTLEGMGRLSATIIRRADHPPCLAQMHEHVQYLTQVPPKEFYLTDATRMAQAFRQVSDWYGMDFPLPFTDIYNYEAEALGARLIYSDIDMPTIDHSHPLIQDPGDLDRVPVDFTIESGRLRYLADNVKAIKEYCGLPRILPFCAPFSLAVGLRSYPRLIRDMRRDPHFAHQLLTWITDEVHPRLIRIIREETGARLGMAADAWACVPNLTLEMLEKWVAPYNARLKENARKLGMQVMVVASGDYCEENRERFNRQTMESCWRFFSRAALGDWVSKGIPIMGMGRTQEWPLEWLRDFASRDPLRLYGKRFVIAGYNARFIREGPIEAIVDYTRRVIDVLGREGRLMFFFAQIPASTPPEHVHAAVSAIKTFGRYPIADDLNRMKWEMPAFEPFEQWLEKSGA